MVRALSNFWVIPDQDGLLCKAASEAGVLLTYFPGSVDLSEWFLEAFNPGWGYLVQVGGSKQFRRGYPDTGLFRHHLGLDGSDPGYLAIRPNPKVTTWAAIDIDVARSPYHPYRGLDALEPLLERCRLMGLRCPLKFRSSFSQGIHLWFPLSKPVKTFRAAVTLNNTLRASELSLGETAEDLSFRGRGLLRLESGLLEAFPNPKDSSSDYQLIRLPFSGEGNGLYVDGFGVVDEPRALPALWRYAAKQNTLIESRVVGLEGFYNLIGDTEKGDPEIIHLNWIRSKSLVCRSFSAVKSKGSTSCPEIASPGSVAEAKSLLSRGWTGRGQTQSLQLAALMVAGSESDCPQLIAQHVRELLTSAPGFLEHCDHVDQINSLIRPGRSACRKAAEFSPAYKGTWKESANQKRSHKASERARSALEMAVRDGLHWKSVGSAVSDLARLYGAPSSCRWWYKEENRILLEMLKSSLG